MTAPRYLFPQPIRRHGTTDSYNKGCRCTLCAATGKSYWSAFFGARDKRERRREYWYLNQYNMTIGELDQLLCAQGSCCKICREPLAPKFGGKGNRNHVDHRHGTQTVRGILDEKCNKGLGYFRDNPVLFERAARYLRTDGRMDDWQDGTSAGLL